MDTVRVRRVRGPPRGLDLGEGVAAAVDLAGHRPGTVFLDLVAVVGFTGA